MPTKNKFAATGKFFGEANEPLSIEAYERYKSKYGEERAIGYLRAIKDVTQTLNEITRGVPAGSQKIKSDVDKLYVHSFLFLKSFDIK